MAVVLTPFDILDTPEALNKLATAINVGGGVSLPLPFFGNSNPPWNGATLASEFTTWLNQGGASVKAISNGPLVVTIPGNGGSPINLIGLLKPLGAAPWTVTFGEALIGVGTDTATNPLILYNSVAKSALAVYWSNPDELGVYLYTSLDSSPNSVVQTWEGTVCADYFGWFRAQNDGTNITLSFSAENIAYLPYFKDTIGNCGGPFDYVGYGGDASQINSALASTTNSTGGSTFALGALWHFTQTSP